MNDRHPSGIQTTPAPAQDADYAPYAPYDQQNAQCGGYAGYDGHAIDGYATDPHLGDHSGAHGAGSYAEGQWATGAHQTLTTPEPTHHDPYAAHQHSPYGTGAYDTTAAWATGTHQQLTDIPAQSGPHDSGHWDTGAWADQSGQWDANAFGAQAQGFTTQDTFATQDAFATGTFQTPNAFETQTFETQTFEAQAFETQAFEAQTFDAQPFETQGFEAPAFETQTFDASAFATHTHDAHAANAHAQAYETQTFEAQAFETHTFAPQTFPGSSAYDSGAYDATAWNSAGPDVDPADAAHLTGHDGDAQHGYGQLDAHEPELSHRAGAPDPAVGHTTDPYGYSTGAEAETDSEADSGDGDADERPASAPRSRSRSRSNSRSASGSRSASSSSSRRRTPAKRSALLTVAVPSVCAIGVAGAAAAAIGGVGGDDKKETTAASAPDATAVKPSVANNKLDTQLAKLSADAGDFADRASRTQERIDLRAKQEAERKQAAEEAARKERLRPKFALPVSQHGLSAYFGQAGINWMSIHTGIDFPVSYGTPVMAATDGTIRSQWNSAYGNMTILTAKDGTETWYCHLSSRTVSSGPVKAGDVIAHSGNSGNSTGPHLHFEVRPGGGSAVDPLPWLRSHGLDPT
ncbi:M23 family metallopeptidase [Streptomyces sp. NPDC046821]|uniref:M23 family metallopeptidase n=1 Tax=Streptomyces sp. NPDC046821 TaxID=3154702 RepID=UPI0033D788A3